MLVTNEMFPHLSGYAIILIALSKIHDNMLPVYVKTCGEHNGDAVKVFQRMLKQTFIPVDKKVSPSGKKLDVPPADSTPTGGPDTTAKDPPVGWSTIASAVRYSKLRGKCLTCGCDGHKSKECTATVVCAHRSVCSTLIRWKYDTSCCLYTPPEGWVAPA